MLTEDFELGLTELHALTSLGSVVLMCAEAVPSALPPVVWSRMRSPRAAPRSTGSSGRRGPRRTA